MIGRVVSAKMQKTVAVLVEGKKTHPLYKKTYVWSKKYLVRDALGAKLGDVVVIEETKPISKRVHWKVIKILGTDVVALGEAAMKQVEEEAIAEVLPEHSDNSETQKVRKSDESEKSDSSESLSSSESSEKKLKKRAKKETKK